MEPSANGSAVRSCAERYAQIRVERETIAAKLKELQEQEEEAKQTLITEMSSQQMPSVKFDGLGRFVIKPAVRYDIFDINLVAYAMLQRMVDNGKNGRPLADGLILQKRASKTVIEELFEADVIKQDDLAGMGLAQAERMDLTFTRQK